MKVKVNNSLIIEYAKAFNYLDVNYIKDLLNDDFRYSSQWVFKEIESKKEYLDYLENKFKVIENSTKKVVARMGLYKNKSCIVLYQIDLSKKNKTQIATLFINEEKGKIKKADMCMIPDANEMQLLDIIPV